MVGKNLSWKKILLITSSVFIVSLLLLGLYIKFFPPVDKDGNSPTILFLGNSQLAPIVYDERGQAKGIAVDIAKEIGKKIGYKVIVKTTNWEDAQVKLLSGEADALLQMNPNPEREMYFDFSDGLLESDFSIFVSSASNISSVDDLKGKSVGVEIQGYPRYILEKYDGIEIITIPSWHIGFNMLKVGQVDAIVVDRWIGEYVLAQRKITGIKVVAEPIETHYSRIAVKKGNTELLNLINDGIRQINEDSTLSNIVRNWKGKKVIYFTEESIRHIILYGIIGILLYLVVVSFYWINRFRKLNEKLEQEVKNRTKDLKEANLLLKKANEELERISLKDPLTNISNRRHLDSILQKVWDISLREGNPLGLIMIDVDYFKHYNDRYGHVTGDKYLVKIANGIKESISKPGDFLARYGGDEFAVLLYNTDEDGAAIIGERIRAQIEELAIYNEPLNSILTVSIGVAAMIPNENINPEDLIDLADKAMYKSKNSGGNRVTRGSRLLAEDNWV